MWDSYQRRALGDHDGEVEINIAGNSESSSILHMLEAHRLEGHRICDEL